MSTIGIDAMSFYVPQLYVEIEDLATAREIPYQKLQKGLGLTQMAHPDVNEDAASFAANALWTLIKDQELDPREIGRIYVGTESAVDGSKPTATYATEFVEQQLSSAYGPRCFKHCDVVDLTFACIGAIDAVQNCLDWIKAGKGRKAIVIASDLSKYELHSTGEYTQGAGAVAVLLSESASLIQIGDTWGIGMQSVGDFFKPRRTFSKDQIIAELMNPEAAKAAKEAAKQPALNSFWADPNKQVSVYKEEPVFDGQYSNKCYSERITEALAHFNAQKPTNFVSSWDYLIFHLPYAYHGRRIILSNWLTWIKDTATYKELIAQVGTPESDPKTWTRRVAKSSQYLEFVNNKIEITERASSRIGNIYTASILMALLSLLVHAKKDQVALADKKLGFIAYGSGSKSKVFQGTVMPGWQDKISAVNLLETLDARTKININTYQMLHTGKQVDPIESNNKIVLTKVEQEKETAIGLRTYATNND